MVTLTDSNFSDRVSKSKDLWMVEFYSPGCPHSVSLKPAWTAAADELKVGGDVGGDQLLSSLAKRVEKAFHSSTN